MVGRSGTGHLTNVGSSNRAARTVLMGNTILACATQRIPLYALTCALALVIINSVVVEAADHNGEAPRAPDVPGGYVTSYVVVKLTPDIALAVAAKSRNSRLVKAAALQGVLSRRLKEAATVGALPVCARCTLTCSITPT